MCLQNGDLLLEGYYYKEGNAFFSMHSFMHTDIPSNSVRYIKRMILPYEMVLFDWIFGMESKPSL